MIVPFRHNYRDIFALWAWNRHSTSIQMNQLAAFQEGVTFIETLGPLLFPPLDCRDIIQVSAWAWHTQLWLYIRKYCQLSIVSLCSEDTVVENKQQQRSEQWAVQGLVHLEQPLHSDARMGQSHRCPAELAQHRARPPSPRTLCALRLAEPPQRFCCHYQHFSYPERSMSYSPPYSPSLFKRPERR